MGVDACVVKIGGGLLAAHGLDGLRAAVADVRALAATGRSVLVVPGGGPFADAVRELDAAVGLDDRTAHELALGAMDQFGTLLATLLPGAARTGLLAAPSGLTILRAVEALAGRPEIPVSWSVTSDSLAVYAAAAIGAPEAILLKAIPGLGVATLTAAALGERSDGTVDEGLAQAIERTGVRVRIRSPGDPAGGTLVTPREECDAPGAL